MTNLDENIIVFSQPHGGLGDNLLYSTLPEKFAAIGKKFYVSSQNVVRNQSTFDLVWGRNPYVHGVIDAPVNAGDRSYAQYASSPKILNIISRIEAAHGFDPSGLVPKLYFQPKFIEELADKIIIDVNSTSIGFSNENISSYLFQMFEWYKLDREKSLQITLESGAYVKNIFRIDGIDPIQLSNLYHYCDVIYSCRAFVTVHSGAHCLAAALRHDPSRKIVTCLVSRDFYNARMAIFPGIEYFVV
mgnify:CR=1 FL=1